SNELRRAIVAAVDTGFLGLITDGNTPTTTSFGASPLGAIGDLKHLLASVALKADSRPLFVMAPDVARAAATLYDSGGGFVFEDMPPTGGVMVGVPAMACDAMTAGTLGLIDGAGIAGDAQGIEIKNARHATIQLNDAPDSPATASTTPISLWQENLVGL